MTVEHCVQPRRAAPAVAVRPTRAEVILGHLRQNYRHLQGLARVPVWGVVKADAYGHGASAVGRALERAGCPGLCVALLEEGVELREAGVGVPILVMSGTFEGAWEELLRWSLTPVLTRADQVEALATAVRRRGGPRAEAHLKLDTGMARLGATLGELPAIAARWACVPEVCLAGFMTHFASADTDPGSVQEQLRAFEHGRHVLEAYGLRPGVLHAANTAATLLHPESRFDRVRVGAGLYGLRLGQACARELQPVLRVRSEVTALRDIPEGAGVGYGHLFRAPRPARIATVPIGYADGYLRALSNRADVLVRGQRAPVVGAISMDLCSVDVTDVPGVELGDEVVVLGAQSGPRGRDTITAEELAERAGTIGWEILTAVSRRVPRFYREP